jgi:hypothetical protein
LGSVTAARAWSSCSEVAGMSVDFLFSECDE